MASPPWVRLISEAKRYGASLVLGWEAIWKYQILQALGRFCGSEVQRIVYLESWWFDPRLLHFAFVLAEPQTAPNTYISMWVRERLLKVLGTCMNVGE